MSNQIFITAVKLLNKKLKERRRKFTLLLIGGGALALAYKIRSEATDLDCQLYPDSNADEVLLYRLRDEIAGELKIDKEWLNTNIGTFLDHFDWKIDWFESVKSMTFSNLKFLAAKPEFLLATKLKWPREKDYQDAVLLFKKLNIKSVWDIDSVINKVVPSGPKGFDFASFSPEQQANIKRYIEIANHEK